MADEINLIALAIPVFFGMIGLEYAASRYMGRDVYRFADAITDLGCGIGQQVSKVFTVVITGAAYLFLYKHARIVDLEFTALSWILGFIGVDLGYYWWHRVSHRMNIIWAAHVVHHQSEDYNLAVALRQTMFGSFSSWVFYLPMAILGVHPVVFGTHAAISLLYQFWIHTQLIDKLPAPIEYIFNTPSHHRVHHGTNPRYLDKNYAGILIIWDRMFGTFEPETEPVVYGTVKKHHSWDPVWAQVSYFVHLYNDAKASETYKDAIQVWLEPPDWRPRNLEPYPPAPEVHPDTTVKWNTDYSPATGWYVGLHFLPITVATTWVIWVEKTGPWATLGAVGVCILLATMAWGALLEGRAGARWFEAVRLLVSTAVVWALTGSGFYAGVALAITAVSVGWLMVGYRSSSGAGPGLSPA